MRRGGCHRRQGSLALGVTEVPEQLLRAAFERVPIRLQMSFEQAMEERMWRLCIRNLAISTAMKGGRL
jgi:hypothetical protein